MVPPLTISTLQKNETSPVGFSGYVPDTALLPVQNTTFSFAGTVSCTV